jgi:uncharacterized protein (TIGR02246 family)
MGAKTPTEGYALWGKHMNAGDEDALLDLYEDDAVVVAAPGQLAEGKAAVREAMKGFFAMKPTVQVGTPTVIEAGETALGHVHWTLKGTGPDGSPVEMESKDATAWRKRPDGTWGVVIDNPWGTGLLG